MAPGRPSGTVSFLFTDIEGSTRLAQDHRQAWEGMRERHHAILSAAMELHGGYVFEIIGDGFCVAFHTAAEALSAAVEAQQRLRQHEWGEAQIKVRMGINTGTAHTVAEPHGSAGYSGYMALARTQRVMSVAYGGQILLSTPSADLVRGELPEGVALRDMSKHRLKGLLNPEHLWQVLAPDLEPDFPALQSLNSIPNNLPVQLTSFIGRESVIAEIRGLVEKNRFVTLTGSGGVGKTRHALQVSAEVLDAFPDGAWLIELASVLDPGLMLPAVATALGVREDPGRALQASLEDHLRHKTLLLILDNCEHLVDASAGLADGLLRVCANLHILVTSREALGTAGEVAFRVPSLSLPDPERPPAPEALSQYDSVRLFIERAVAVKSDFAVTNENAPAVAQVCARLDGIPLAIELAAARVLGLSAQQIAQRLDDRFRLLTGGSRSALPRHQTLRAMIEWSYDLLSEPERRVLRQLTVFIGDFALEAAEAVCASPAEPAGAAAPAGVMELLLRLVDKSLVTPHEESGRVRYRLLETIRQFASEKLSEAAEAPSVRSRHLEYYLGFSEQSASRLQSAERWSWLRESASEYENLRVALKTAGESSPAQPAARLAAATGQLAEVELLRGAGTKALPLFQEALDLWNSVEGADQTPPTLLNAKIIETLSYLWGRVDAADFVSLLRLAEAPRAALEAALARAHSEPPSSEAVHYLVALSLDSFDLREPRDAAGAERYARQAVALAERLGSAAALSKALGALAYALFLRGPWRERAEVSIRRIGLGPEAQGGDLRERAFALNDASAAANNVGEYAQGLRFALEAEAIGAELRLPYLEKEALDHRIHCLLGLDLWDEVLDVDVKLRDMRQRYPREQMGMSCFAIAAVARIRALHGELDLAREGRLEADAIMTRASGPDEEWGPFQHY